MERKIDFRFNGHSGAFSARPVKCPLNKDVCAAGTMRYDMTWLVFDELGGYRRCQHFAGLGPDVLKEGTSNKFPIIVECRRED